MSGKMVDRLIARVDFLLAIIVYQVLMLTPAMASQRRDDWSGRPVSMKEGLPCANVDGLFPDDRGFMWISMFGGGISRFDGRSFITFSGAGTADSGRAIGSNMVTESCQDGFDRMWLSTAVGLELIDMRTLRTIPVPDEILKSSKGRFCNYLTLDSTGCLWYGVADCMYRAEFMSDGSLRSLDSLRCSGTNPDLRLNMRDIEGDGSVWTAIDGRLYRIFKSEGKGLDMAPLFNSVSIGENGRATDFLRRGDEIWVGTDDGLYQLNATDGSWRRFEHSETDHGSLAHNSVTSLAVTSDGDLFVGTLDGVSVLDRNSSDFITYRSEVDEYGNRLLSSNLVRSMAAVGNTVWIGTELDGITVFEKKRLPVSNVTHRENDFTSLPGTPVSAVCFDSKGRLWAGSLGYGLFVAGSDYRFANWSSRNSDLPHNTVISLEKGPDRTVWIGTGEGVCYSRESDPGCMLLPAGSLSETARKIRTVNDLVFDEEHGRMWILSRSGLFYYDFALSEYVQYDTEKVLCFSAGKDRFGKLWVGHRDGVSGIDLNSLDCSCSIDLPLAFFIDIDSYDNLWIGSFDHGLYVTRISAQGCGELRGYSSGDGLADDRIRSVISNGDCLWVGTENGLSKVSILSGGIESFTLSDGLASMAFYDNASAVSPEGMVFLGQKTGLSILRSNFVKPFSAEGKVISFTSAFSGGKETDLVYSPSMKVREKDGVFGFEFADFTPGGDANLCFSCIIEPLDKDWRAIDAGKRTVRYGALPGGRYTLRLRAVDKSGRVVAADSRELRVVPLFWNTWWFDLLVLAAGLLGVACFIRARIRWLVRKREELQDEVDRQTIILEEQKARLKNMVDALMEQNRMLLRQSEDLAGKTMILNSYSLRRDSDRKDSAFVEKLLESVEALYKDPLLDINGLAAHMGMSRSVLNGRIHDSFGKSIGQFIRTYRLNVAREMICSRSSEDMNVSEIAYEVGFNDPKYFTRCFSREFGMAPSVMRNGGMSPDPQSQGSEIPG